MHESACSRPAFRGPAVAATTSRRRCQTRDAEIGGGWEALESVPHTHSHVLPWSSCPGHQLLVTSSG